MIRAVIVMNTDGKPRPLKFYDFRVPEISSFFSLLPWCLHSNWNRLFRLTALACSSLEVQPPEKQQELIRSVFTGRKPVIPIIWKRTLNSPLLLRSFYIFATKFPLIFLRHYAVVLSGRPDNVSNFVAADAIFGSVILSSLTLSLVAERRKPPRGEHKRLYVWFFVTIVPLIAEYNSSF